MHDVSRSWLWHVEQNLLHIKSYVHSYIMLIASSILSLRPAPGSGALALGLLQQFEGVGIGEDTKNIKINEGSSNFTGVLLSVHSHMFYDV